MGTIKTLEVAMFAAAFYLMLHAFIGVIISTINSRRQRRQRIKQRLAELCRDI